MRLEEIQTYFTYNMPYLPPKEIPYTIKDPIASLKERKMSFEEDRHNS